MVTINTQENKLLHPTFGKPHVVILGAGASRAAFPKGDRNGHKLPLMKDLIEILELVPLLKKCGWNDGESDFEAFYSRIYNTGQYPEILYSIEQVVFKYFSTLELPDSPTLYDRLVLSLRKKDLIATFNWDPLLWQAMRRLAELFGEDILPSALYLHGNVAIAYCHNHKPSTIGNRGSHCSKCGSILQHSRLLYPVTEKNYYNDPSIEKSWNEVKKYLKYAFMFTVFGYGAPQTDVEAMNLMKQAWGNANSRQFEQIEIIDIRKTHELHKSWEYFICKNHYSIRNKFYDSFAAQHPRRSCEDFWEAIMQNNPQKEHPIPCKAHWEQLENWIRPLLEQEQKV